MRERLLVVGFLMLRIVSVSAQTASEIEARYGKSEKVYSVSEHIWMTPTYAADGQPCEITLYPKRVSPGTTYFFQKLPAAELKVVLEQLVPFSNRGTRQYESFPWSEFWGHTASTTYPFEKVTFVFLSSFEFTSSPKQSKPLESFDIETSSSPKQTEDLWNTNDDVPNAWQPEAEIVEIRWSNRKCVEK